MMRRGPANPLNLDYSYSYLIEQVRGT